MFDRRGPGATLVLLGVLVGLFGLSVAVNYFTSAPVEQLSYSKMLELVDGGQVSSVNISGQQLTGVKKDGSAFATHIIPSERLWEKLSTANINVGVTPEDNYVWFYYLCAGVLGLGLIIALFAAFSYFRQMQEGGGGNARIFNVGRSKARFYSANEVNVRFSDVAGVEEVKEELMDIIQFLKNPRKFSQIGAKIPRGILLSGEPGNGKTMLAKAVAGEAGCPFFSISGSDFVEVFVGVGASRVRDLFAQARRHAPCIVFVDEIDAVGRKRGVGTGGGNDEREQTLNQLLAEMDGFETNPGAVIILAATNRADVLDHALLRPGRFDRIVEVPFPDLHSRYQILKVHARKVKLAPDVSLEQIARGTAGFSGAQLANLVNEAALVATKAAKREITIDDFEFARDKLLMGAERKTIALTEQDKRKTAYHEAGHAILNILLPETDPLHKVTIVPRGRALGVSMSLPERDSYSHGREEILSRIMVLMGGLVSEKMVFGESTSGVAEDLRMATNIARTMVAKYGMSKLGPVSYVEPDEGYPQASATAAKVDDEVRRILIECQERAESLLAEHRGKVDALAQALVERETLSANEVYELLQLTPRELHSFHPDTVGRGGTATTGSAADDKPRQGGGTPNPQDS